MIWFVLFWLVGVIVAASLVINRQSRYVAAAKARVITVTGNNHHLREKLESITGEHDKKLRDQRKQYEDRLHEKDSRVQRIVDELSHIQWRRGNGPGREQYMVTITVCPDLFGGRHLRDDLIYIARYIGDQVSHELASYKFVQKANEYERGEYRRPRPFIPTRNESIGPDTPYP